MSLTRTKTVTTNRESSHYTYYAPVHKGVAAFIFLEVLVLSQAWLAYRNNFLTVSEMQEGGVDLGLPFIWHFGMWGDAFVISPLVAYFVGRYSSRWRLHWTLASLALGIAVAVIMGWSYTLPNVQEAHVENHRLTAAGVLHLVYMAVALAGFLLFFLFTNDVSRRLLRIASVLVVIHVLAGTHMALGLLHLVIPLDWYPAHPLESIVGWIIIAAVSFGLIWRNVGNSKMCNALVLIYMFLTTEDPRPLAGYLKFLNRISDLLITITYFFKLFRAAIGSGIDRLSLDLLLVIAIKYFFSRLGVKQELEIGKALYPPGRIPDDLLPKTRLGIAGRVFGFLALYALLGSLSNYIFWASLIFTVIAANDVRTRSDISSNVLRTFNDARYQPAVNEAGYQVIMERRKIARWYLSELPTSVKEWLTAVGCAAACVTAALGYVSGSGLDVAAYEILIVATLLNELITLWWRIKRFRLLLAVDRCRPVHAPATSLSSGRCVD